MSLISIGTVVAAVSLLNRLVSPASTLQGIGLDISTSLAIFSRIFDMLDMPVDIQERPGAADFGGTHRTLPLSIRGVRFRYSPSGPWILDDIDLDVPAGTTTAIVGHTGSGKTTLAYLVARLYEPERGKVCINGVDVRDVTFSSLAATVGLISQETHLFHASIAENLRYARPDATDADLERAARGARISCKPLGGAHPPAAHSTRK